MNKSITNSIFIFIVIIVFSRLAYGADRSDSSTSLLDDLSNDSVTNSFGIYQIAWNPAQFRRELDKNLSILNGKPSVVMFYRDISYDRGFPSSYAEIIDNTDTIPMISWEWCVWGRDGDYLSDILKGRFDAYFARWSSDCKKWGRPLFIRPGFEMNGNWFSWGGKPEKFKVVWKHIYKLFKDSGCDNAIWVWSPNYRSSPDKDCNRMEEYYPGDEFVDWVGLDGYNWGDENPKRPYFKWETFDDIFSGPLKRIGKLAPEKPIMISETGCAESDSNSKGKWIDSLFVHVKKMPRLKLFIWFNYDKRGEGEKDWRINSSTEALSAFNKNLIRNDMY